MHDVTQRRFYMIEGGSRVKGGARCRMGRAATEHCEAGHAGVEVGREERRSHKDACASCDFDVLVADLREAVAGG